MLPLICPYWGMQWPLIAEYWLKREIYQSKLSRKIHTPRAWQVRHRIMLPSFKLCKKWMGLIESSTMGLTLRTKESRCVFCLGCRSALLAQSLLYPESVCPSWLLFDESVHVKLLHSRELLLDHLSTGQIGTNHLELCWRLWSCKRARLTSHLPGIVRLVLDLNPRA